MSRHDWFLVCSFLVALAVAIAAHNDAFEIGAVICALIITRTARP